jgi:hypothetical protein
MKRIFLIIAILFACCSLSAQKKELLNKKSFSLGADLALPIGLFGEVYSFGIGLSAQANFPVSSSTALTIYSGYDNYFLKKTYGSGNQGFIPLMGGVEVNISPVVFGSMQAGITLYTQNVGKAFSYTPGVGFKLNKNFIALIKYIGKVKSAINSGAIGVRIAYTFGK